MIVIDQRAYHRLIQAVRAVLTAPDAHVAACGQAGGLAVLVATGQLPARVVTACLTRAAASRGADATAVHRAVARRLRAQLS